MPLDLHLSDQSPQKYPVKRGFKLNAASVANQLTGGRVIIVADLTVLIV
jgi:hypothetical protein